MAVLREARRQVQKRTVYSRSYTSAHLFETLCIGYLLCKALPWGGS